MEKDNRKVTVAWAEYSQRCFVEIHSIVTDKTMLVLDTRQPMNEKYTDR